MGLRNRLKSRLKETLGGVSALARIIHDEANHPGRPQPHMAARNPLWGGGEVDGPESEESANNTPETTTTSTESESKEGEESDYWFLHDPDGEADDWSSTNPKKK